MALFGNDDGYVVAPLQEAKEAISTFKRRLRDRCGLLTQEEKTEIFSRRALNVEELGGMKRAGKDLEEGVAPGFVCYGIPVGSKEYVSHMLKEKAEEVAREVEEISDILGQDSQISCTQNGLSFVPVLPLRHPHHCCSS